MSKEKSSIGFGIGLLAGVIGGIVAGILYAPRPGSEMREKLKDAVCDMAEKLSRTMGELREANERLALEASDAQAAEKPLEPEPKKEKPRRPGGTKNLEKEVAAAERAVAKAEEQMFDLEEQIQAASADYLKLQELYEQRETLEEEILKLYGAWESLSAQLEEARG